jgi:RNA polymerase sigma-70 factor (ECF subfamily)
LLRAYRSIRTYGHRSAFASWIGRVAANCAISRLREQQREHRRLRALASTRSDPRQAASPEYCLVVGELAGSIRDRVGALPLKQRAAFTLFHLQEMSLAQTAQATGCSVNATKVQLHRARRRLARRLADHLQQG